MLPVFQLGFSAAKSCFPTLILSSLDDVALEFSLHSHGPAYCLAIMRTIWSERTHAWWSLELVLRFRVPLITKTNLPHLIISGTSDLRSWTQVILLGLAQYVPWVRAGCWSSKMTWWFDDSTMSVPALIFYPFIWQRGFQPLTFKPIIKQCRLQLFMF